MYNMPNFWAWFFKGQDGSTPGWKGMFDGWMVLHIGVGCLSYFVNEDLNAQAEKVIFPFSGILIGITFAWSGNITSLLSTRELSIISDIGGNGIQAYVFSVQRAILAILCTVVLWCVAALSKNNYFFVKFLCYALSSYSMRESWQVILFAQYMTISRKHASDMLNHTIPTKKRILRGKCLRKR